MTRFGQPKRDFVSLHIQVVIIQSSKDVINEMEIIQLGHFFYVSFYFRDAVSTVPFHFARN